MGGREFKQRQIHAPMFSAEPDGGTGWGWEGWVSADTFHFPPEAKQSVAAVGRSVPPFNFRLIRDAGPRER